MKLSWQNCFLWLILMIPVSIRAQERLLFTDSSSNISIYYLSINTKADEYSAYPYKNSLIYCSNSKSNILPYYSTRTNNLLDHLVISHVQGEAKWSKPKLLLKEAWVKSIQGPSTINSSGNVIFFTGSGLTEEETKENTSGLLKIYEGKIENGKCTEIKEFPFNHKKYSVGHPALSNDGLTLLFASNIPGGFGGSDLYVTYFKNGKWTRPKNLGSKVNTKGNELFPYLNKENILFFSSDMHQSTGKLDIFSAQFIDSIWQNVKNVGSPFNSEHDDFGYSEDLAGFSGYFSSNRKTGKDFDIYRFEKIQPECDTVTPYPYCFTFYETGTLQDETLPLVYEWDFGDGSKKRGLEVNHCFKRPGTYQINLNIIDTISGKIYFNEASYEMEVEALNKPHIEITGRRQPGMDLDFSAEKSHLADCIINEYFWDFGDGIKSEGINVNHVYETKGEFTANLLVKGKSASTGTNCMACVNTIVYIGEKGPAATQDSSKQISDLATVLHTIKNEKDLVFKVQVATSDYPIPIDSINFKNLENVKEYKNQDSYGYVVGEETSLSLAYPLYLDIKEKGYEDAIVVAFKDGKIITGKDTSQFKKQSVTTQSFTQISGRIINRYGDPLSAEIILENLSTGKIISKVLSDSVQGRFHIILPNEELYGFYADLEGYYSVSNYIDLRTEKRNLEIRKNIEMIAIKDLNDTNLAIRLNNIFFDLNQYNLKKESYPELNRLAELLRDPKLKIEISGHTDNSGSPEANLILSQKRADAVRDYLGYLGIDKDKIISIGYGDTKPLVSNENERGRYLNRRVEFRLFNNTK